MSNRAMTLVRKRSFDFSDNTAGVPTAMIAVEACDVTCFGDALLVVRVHSNEISTGTSEILVEAYNTAPSDEDPDVTFVEATAAASTTVEQAIDMPAGTLLVDGVTSGFGPALQIRVTGTRQSSDTVRAELSIELVARSGVTAPRRSLADTLVVGNSTGGTSIIVSSSDAVRGEDGEAPTGLTLRAGNGTIGDVEGANATLRGGTGSGSEDAGDVTVSGGAAGTGGTGGLAAITGGSGGSSSGEGGWVAIAGGAAVNGAGGSVTITGGDGSSEDGDVDLLTPSSTGAIRLRTQSTFTGTRWEHLTFGTQQVIVFTGNYDITLGTLSTNGRNLKLEVLVTAHENGTNNSIRSAMIVQTAYRASGTVTLLTAHVSNTQGAGNLNSDPMTFSLVVSGDNILLRTNNGSGSNSRTVNIAVRWSRQEGGFSS